MFRLLGVYVLSSIQRCWLPCVPSSLQTSWLYRYYLSACLSVGLVCLPVGFVVHTVVTGGGSAIL